MFLLLLGALQASKSGGLLGGTSYSSPSGLTTEAADAGVSRVLTTALLASLGAPERKLGPGAQVASS